MPPSNFNPHPHRTPPPTSEGFRCYGLDFTSSPSRKKPLVVCEGWLSQGKNPELTLTQWHAFAQWDMFESWLENAPGPWHMAVDFPLGVPHVFHHWLEASEHHWPQWLLTCDKASWIETLHAFSGPRPLGHKKPKRQTDQDHHAISPLMTTYVPVAHMMFEGLPRFLRHRFNILPIRPTEDNRTVVEGYPGSWIRWLQTFNGHEKPIPYKDGKATDRPQRYKSRMAILDALQQPGCMNRLGFSIHGPLITGPLLTVEMDWVEHDIQGDFLDSLLCCVQGAYVCQHQHAMNLVLPGSYGMLGKELQAVYYQEGEIIALPPQ